MLKSHWRYILAIFIGFIILITALVLLTVALIYPKLPSLDTLTNYQPKIPMRVYTADGALLAEFGAEHRAVVALNKTPKFLQQAILAAEDDRFYQHGGVDTMGVMRAALSNLTSGGAKEGASTITMQVARNFFLSSEKTLTRKLNEALLAIKIEHTLSKDEILTLYINQIYLGQRAYGFGAASLAYFGKPLEKINLAEAAMLAGLPKAPSRYNPVVNFPRAQARQHYVLRRMLDLNYIDNDQYQAAINQPLIVRTAKEAGNGVSADYVAEMIRQAMYDRYQDAIYTNGLKVYTTLRKHDQDVANLALWQGVEEYDHRHGYRGIEGNISLPADAQAMQAELDNALQDIATVHDLVPAVVLSSNAKRVHAYVKDIGEVDIRGDGLKFAQKLLANSPQNKLALHPGALIRVQKVANTDNWRINQLPQVEAAFVSLDPKTGAIRALVGGIDYDRNKFNHVTQAWRQPGSTFKPFIYSAALEKGFTAATLVEDAPITISPDQTGGVLWEPKNYEGDYSGIVSVRKALTKSLNLPTIRILQAISPAYAQDYIKRFGFDPARQPPYLTLALGAGSVTPLQLASAYAVFANNGQQIKPYLIDHIIDQNGNTILKTVPDAAKPAIDPRNAFIITSLMHDVVTRGTAAKVTQLGRSDLAGKTGTTNDQVDAWFAGFQPSLVAVAWIGFDQPRTLGRGETGAQAALPMWMKYMGEMLKGVPQATFTQPKGVVRVPINPLTGLPVGEGETGTPEYFYEEAVPIATTHTAAPSEGLDTPAPDQSDTKTPEPSSPLM
ncbi:penicillin-binding protein 1A [Sulfuriferula thiophila]|uniref:penicillin-binding protein 1A n=1 Tax=Sulfuriferula thiophila TaxID=1781211 RepID=UPI000F6064F4|nr:penicillin-binding protein 1A [Sulfuriferula thiophila]